MGFLDILFGKNLDKLFELINENDKLRQEQFQSFSMYIEEFWKYNSFENFDKKESDLLYEIYNKSLSKAYYRDKERIIDPRRTQSAELNHKYQEAYNNEVWKRNYTIDEKEIEKFIYIISPFIKKNIEAGDNYCPSYVWLVGEYLAIDNHKYNTFSCKLSDYFSGMNIPVNRDAVALRVYIEFVKILNEYSNSNNEIYGLNIEPYKSDVSSWNDFNDYDVERFNMDFGNATILKKYKKEYWISNAF